MEAVLKTAQHGIAAAAANIVAIDASIADINEALVTKATVREVRECVTRRHYEQAVAALGADLDTRSTQQYADQLRDQLRVCLHSWSEISGFN